MKLVRRIVRDAAIGVAVVEAPEDLVVFQKPGVAAAIWRRQPSKNFQQWIDDLDPSCLPSARSILRPADVRAAVGHVCDSAGMPPTSQRQQLVDDVAALADLFAGLMGVDLLRLRLNAVRDNACRKFHIDAVTARLVCAYRGLGPQYGISTDGAEPRRIFMVSTGAPILLRGAHWPTPPASGLLHRSPPIEGSGQVRLVLVLDPIADPEAEI